MERESIRHGVHGDLSSRSTRVLGQDEFSVNCVLGQHEFLVKYEFSVNNEFSIKHRFSSLSSRLTSSCVGFGPGLNWP